MLSCSEEKMNSGVTLLEQMKLLGEFQNQSGVRKTIDSELWHACAGPLVSLPEAGGVVYYFPQGHTEQVAVSTKRAANSQIPNYPNLPSQLMCQVHNVTLHADKDTDEIYAQMTLRPINSETDVLSIPEFGQKQSSQPSEVFCKTLTSSDTSTHGGFSVPRKAAEKLFPSLDYSMQPPTQELVVRDLHDNSWTFRHIYRGQPKRHLLTTGWSSFVGAKRLKAGDSVLFIRDKKSQLLLGVRRANHQNTTLSSSVLSADSMLIGVLAAAAHAATNRSPFTVFYNPRACTSEFVIPLAKHHRAVYGNQVSIGMRFGMMFETEESSKRRYMGTIIGISDIDPVRWPNSKWRNLQVEWDETGWDERKNRVSLWEIETPDSLFIFPSLTSSLKRPSHSGHTETEWENIIKRPSRVPENGNGDFQYPLTPAIGLEELMKMLHKSVSPSTQLESPRPLDSTIVQHLRSNEFPKSYSSSGRASYMKGILPHQEERVTETSAEQKHHLVHVQQQLVSFQNILLPDQNDQHGIEQLQVVSSNLSSRDHIHPREQFKEEILPKQMNPGVQDKDIEQTNDHPVNKYETPLLHTEHTEKLDTAPEEALGQQKEHTQRIMRLSLQQIHTGKLSQFNSSGIYSEEKTVGIPPSSQNLVNQLLLNQGASFQLQAGTHIVPQQLEPLIEQPQQTETPPLETNNPNSFQPYSSLHSPQYLEIEDWLLQPSSCQSLTSVLKSPRSLCGTAKLGTAFLSASVNASTMANPYSPAHPETINNIERVQFPYMSHGNGAQCFPSFGQELVGSQQLNYIRYISQAEQHTSGVLSSRVHDISVQPDMSASHNVSNLCGLRDFVEESIDQSMTYGSLHFEASSGNTDLEDFSTIQDGSFRNPSGSMVGNFSSSQDVQSQITSASLSDSYALSLQELSHNSGGTSSSNVDVDESSLLPKDSWQQVPPPLRTYTKVQKLGSVGRSIDVTQYKNYNELKFAIACMFGLEEQLNDPRGSGWELVYVDYENDVLLVGDDPWEEFVSCVRCIKILSPSEVHQMSQEGMQLLNSPIIQGNMASFPEGTYLRDGP